MKRRTRTLLIASIVLLVVAAVAIAVALRRREAPEPARLLPEADAVIYVNAKTIRRLTSFGEKPATPREPEYEEFVRETGFQFERDLDEAAVAIHTAQTPANRAPENRYSEIFVGRFNAERGAAYLQKISQTVERYREVNIYNIPVENRIVRAAIVGMDTVAVSNTEGTQAIHGMIDRYKQMALPFGGPALLREHYRDVPFASLVWAIVRVPEKPSDPRQSRSLTLPGGFDVFIPQNSVMVASARFTGTIHARIDLIAQTDQDAAKFSEQAGTFLELFRALEGNTAASGTDPDVKAVFDSLKIVQEGPKATLSATIPLAFFKKILSEPPVELSPQPKSDAAEKPKKEPKLKGKTQRKPKGRK